MGTAPRWREPFDGPAAATKAMVAALLETTGSGIVSGIVLAPPVSITLNGNPMRDVDIRFHMIPGGPMPVAPFSHATENGGFVFITGQMPDSPDAPGRLPDGIEAQTVNVMANLALVLDGVGLGFTDVLMVRAYLTRFREDYALFNATYRQYFAPDRLPARTCIGVTGLAYDALVEIDLIARRP